MLGGLENKGCSDARNLDNCNQAQTLNFYLKQASFGQHAVGIMERANLSPVFKNFRPLEGDELSGGKLGNFYVPVITESFISKKTTNAAEATERSDSMARQEKISHSRLVQFL